MDNEALSSYYAFDCHLLDPFADIIGKIGGSTAGQCPADKPQNGALAD
jgi:hypothetical protein